MSESQIDRDKQRHIYEAALASQGGSNLMGLVGGLNECLQVIAQERVLAGGGTEFINKHPAVRLYMEQLWHLCGGQNGEMPYGTAHAECVYRKDNGYLPTVEFVFKAVIVTTEAEDSVRDKVQTFINDAFLSKEYFAKPYPPAEKAELTFRSGLTPKPFPPYKEKVNHLMPRQIAGSSTIELRMICDQHASPLDRRLAAYDLLMACLCDNEEVPGGPTRAHMYVTEYGMDGGYAIRMECLNEADLQQAKILCEFEADGYLDY